MHLASRINWRLGVVMILLWTVAVPLVFGSENVADAATQALPKYAVGVVTDTFVDAHRTTPAWDGSPQLPTRLLSPRSSTRRLVPLVVHQHRVRRRRGHQGPTRSSSLPTASAVRHRAT